MFAVSSAFKVSQRIKQLKMADNAKGSAASGSSSADTVDIIRQYLADKLKIFSESTSSDGDIQILETVDFDGLVKHWKKNNFKRIITMVGAGISTSAGIPDFRSPSTGLYNNLQKYKLPYPTAIFEVDYFRSKPKPFFALAKELYPGSFKPTPCHYFIKLLHEKGLLVRHYTQNIDTLERMAGIPDEMLVEAHGTFHTNHCLDCRKEYSMEWMKNQIFTDVIPTCELCNALVKPDIVFFGENLPDKFYTFPKKDFEDCDLLIIMGTSLEVQPFASLIDHVSDKCVRLLINREKVGIGLNSLRSCLFGDGLAFDMPGNKRDVLWLGDCDDGVQKLAEELGYKEELAKLVEKEHRKIDEKLAKEKDHGNDAIKERADDKDKTEEKVKKWKCKKTKNKKASKKKQ